MFDAVMDDVLDAVARTFSFQRSLCNSITEDVFNQQSALQQINNFNYSKLNIRLRITTRKFTD